MSPIIPPLPPGTHKIRIYNVKTGEPVERWPVDAEGMIRCGEFSLTRPVADGGENDVSGTSEATPPEDRGGDPVVELVSESSAGPAQPVSTDTARVEHSPGVPLVVDKVGSPAKPLAAEAPKPKRAPRSKK